MMTLPITVLIILGVVIIPPALGAGAGRSKSGDNQGNVEDDQNEPFPPPEVTFQYGYVDVQPSGSGYGNYPAPDSAPYFDNIAEALEYPSYSPSHQNPDHQIFQSYYEGQVNPQSHHNQFQNQQQEDSAANDHQDPEQSENFQQNLPSPNHPYTNYGESSQRDVTLRHPYGTPPTQDVQDSITQGLSVSSFQQDPIYSPYGYELPQITSPLLRNTMLDEYGGAQGDYRVPFQSHGATFAEYDPPVEQGTPLRQEGTSLPEESSYEIPQGSMFPPFEVTPLHSEAGREGTTNYGATSESHQHVDSSSNLGQSSKDAPISEPEIVSKGDYNLKFKFDSNKFNKKYCYLRLSDLPDNHGIFTNSNQTNTIYPTYYDHLKLKDGSVIKGSCPGNASHFNLVSTYLPHQTKQQHIDLQCRQGRLFYLDEQRELAEHEYRCSQEPIPILQPSRMMENQLCIRDLKSFESGFIVKHNLLKILANFCVLEEEMDMDYMMHVKYVITMLDKDLKGQEAFGNFNGIFYSGVLNVDRYIFHEDVTWLLYEKERVKNSLITQLSSWDKYNELTQGLENVYYIKPGFLAGKCDNVYRMEQKTAYHYANLKPQWSNLQKNWDVVEKAICWFSIQREASLMVFSGTEGIFTHADSYGVFVDLYLGIHGDMFYDPIPDKFWKIVQNSDGACIVIVGHNTPYDVQDKVCNDVTHAVHWLGNLQVGKQYGVVYACHCDDTEWIDYMPPLQHNKNKKRGNKKYGQPLLI